MLPFHSQESEIGICGQGSKQDNGRPLPFFISSKFIPRVSSSPAAVSPSLVPLPVDHIGLLLQSSFLPFIPCPHLQQEFCGNPQTQSARKARGPSKHVGKLQIFTLPPSLVSNPPPHPQLWTTLPMALPPLLPQSQGSKHSLG